MEAHIKERAINMRPDEVRAVLSGSKVQTRRPVKPQPDSNMDPVWIDELRCFQWATLASRRWCPFGEVGDRLWVKETWQAYEPQTRKFGGPGPIGQATMRVYAYPATPDSVIEYRADHPDQHGWRPSIHMPRWASRLTLEITDIRVQRVQEIREEDALTEGFGVDACARVFEQASRRVPWKYMRWLETAEGECDETDLCVDCARKLARKKDLGLTWHGVPLTVDSSKDWIVCGWDESPESDTALWCDKCRALLCHSLTEYGVDRELFLESPDCDPYRNHFAARGEDAAILANLAGGIGDLHERHHGRLAQCAFATHWEKLYGKGAWDANPFVWALTFRRAEVLGE